MSKYKVGDRVKVRKNLEQRNYKMEHSSHGGWYFMQSMSKLCGETVTIKSVDEEDECYRIVEDELRWTDEMFECLVEDNKMFTKEDIKTGMFGVMDNGNKFVIVNDRIVYQHGPFDELYSLNDNFEMCYNKIDKLYTGIKSFTMLESTLKTGEYGKVVWERKPLYNGKVVCINNHCNEDNYTVGKIYQFTNGHIKGDNGLQFPHGFTKIYSFKDWERWTGAKFIEIKE